MNQLINYIKTKPFIRKYFSTFRPFADEFFLAYQTKQNKAKLN